jgi:hypothetical protein
MAFMLAIRDGHLIIEFGFPPKFPPESYSFAIANPEAADTLVTAFMAEASASRAEYPPPGLDKPDMLIWAWRKLTPKEKALSDKLLYTAAKKNSDSK